MKVFEKVAMVLAMTTPVVAQAAVDVSDITDLSVDVLAVGGAVFGILVIIKGIKLLRRTL